MPGDIWADPGFWMMVAAATMGGLVRGFTGFGTAMVFIPVAARVVGPVEAITTMLVMDAVGPLPLVRRAIRAADPRELRLLGLGLLVGVPTGVALLTSISPDSFRWAVSALSLVLLVLLVGGFRYRGRLSAVATAAVGFAGGFTGGAAGLAGPPVILAYMSSSRAAASIRANILLYLIMSDLVFLGIVWWRDLLSVSALATGLILVVPYGLASVAGAAIFHPDRGRVYRAVAYVVIGGSAILGLPVIG